MESEPSSGSANSDQDALENCFKRLNIDNNPEDGSNELMKSLSGLYIKEDTTRFSIE